tara:strand:- start:13 stop:261 length:249 start_codon:yes stop_codon:yes gene_type:complete
MSRWTDWVKKYAREHNTTYGCALSQPKCSATYRREYGLKATAKNEAYFKSAEKASSKAAKQKEYRDTLREKGVYGKKQLRDE